MFLLFTNVIVFIAELVILVVIHFLTCGCHLDAGDISVAGCIKTCGEAGFMLAGLRWAF